MINRETWGNKIVVYKEVTKQEFQTYLDSYTHSWFTVIMCPTDPYQEHFIDDNYRNCYVDGIIAKMTFYDGVQNPRYYIKQ